MRKMVNDYYEDTGEQKLVSKAIAKAWVRERGFSDNSIDFDGVKAGTGKLNTLRYVCVYVKNPRIYHNQSISIIIQRDSLVP